MHMHMHKHRHRAHEYIDYTEFKANLKMDVWNYVLLKIKY